MGPLFVCYGPNGLDHDTPGEEGVIREVPQWGIRRRRKRGERVNRNEQCDRSKGAVRRLRLRKGEKETVANVSLPESQFH